MSKTDKPRLSLCVRFEEDNSSFLTGHACIKTIVTVEYWRENGSTYQWSGVGTYAPLSLRGYDDLQYTNFTFEDQHDNGSYQATMAYHAYSTQLHDAERMVKTLKGIDNTWEKMTKREGYPKSFGQAVNRLARIVGADVVRVEKTEIQQGRTGERYTEHYIGDSVFSIDHRIGEWLREKREAKQPQQQTA